MYLLFWEYEALRESNSHTKAMTQRYEEMLNNQSGKAVHSI